MNRQITAINLRFFFRGSPLVMNQASTLGYFLRSQGSIMSSRKGIIRRIPPAQAIHDPQRLLRNRNRFSTIKCPPRRPGKATLIGRIWKQPTGHERTQAGTNVGGMGLRKAGRLREAGLMRCPLWKTWFARVPAGSLESDSY